METALVSTTTNQKEQDLFRTISLTALLTGTLDLVASNIHFYFTTHHGALLKLAGMEEPVSMTTYLTNGGPGRVFKYVASAVFGEEANSGGRLMATWGAVFHYMIAFIFTAFFFIIYPKIIRWLRNKFIVAVTYGLFTWAVMNFAVVPLSRINKLPSDWENVIVAALIPLFMIGLPVALIADCFYSQKRRS